MTIRCSKLVFLVATQAFVLAPHSWAFIPGEIKDPNVALTCLSASGISDHEERYAPEGLRVWPGEYDPLTVFINTENRLMLTNYNFEDDAYSYFEKGDLVWTKEYDVGGYYRITTLNRSSLFLSHYYETGDGEAWGHVTYNCQMSAVPTRKF